VKLRRHYAPKYLKLTQNSEKKWEIKVKNPQSIPQKNKIIECKLTAETHSETQKMAKKADQKGQNNGNKGPKNLNLSQKIK
jgi:hypothetical protein